MPEFIKKYGGKIFLHEYIVMRAHNKYPPSAKGSLKNRENEILGPFQLDNGFLAKYYNARYNLIL